VVEFKTEITEHKMDMGSNMQFSMEQSSSYSSSRNWERDVMQETDNVIEGIERMTEGIMAGVQRMTEEAGRLTSSLFEFPSFPGNEREEIHPIFSCPVIEEKEEEEERDEHEIQKQEQLYTEFADKIKEV
jgi:hypothetical protein